jgi:hypothetical protein
MKNIVSNFYKSFLQAYGIHFEGFDIYKTTGFVYCKKYPLKIYLGYCGV